MSREGGGVVVSGFNGCVLDLSQVSKSTSLADEVLGNIRTVRAFGMEDVEDK